MIFWKKRTRFGHIQVLEREGSWQGFFILVVGSFWPFFEASVVAINSGAFDGLTFKDLKFAHAYVIMAVGLYMWTISVNARRDYVKHLFRRPVRVNIDGETVKEFR